MTLIKRNKVWHYQTKIEGKTFRRSTGQTDRRLAEKVVQQIKDEVRLRKKQPEDWLRLSQAINREVARIETDISAHQAERALTVFSVFLAWMKRDLEITEITGEVLEAYQRHRLKTKSLSTVNKDLHFVLRMLRENDIYLPKPCAKQGRETEIRPFSHDELLKIFNHVTDHFRPLYATLLVTGARPAELIPSSRSTHKALLKSEIDFENGVIRLRQAKGRCGKRPRQRPPIPLPEDVLILLKEQISRTPSEYPFVFTPNTNTYRDFDAALHRAGIPKVDPAGRKLLLHGFRHTYATLMAEQVQNNPHFLKAILGHSKITTTDRYCQVEATVVPISRLNLSLRSKPRNTDQAATVQDVPQPQTA
jgi:integrase